MSRVINSRLVSLGALSLGVALCATAARGIRESGELEREPNILCLKGSPFGKTIAMAMQGPVDVYWHEGEAHDHVHAPGESCSECDHESEAPPASDLPDAGAGAQTIAVSTESEKHDVCDQENCDHRSHAGHVHAEGESCAGCDQHEDQDQLASRSDRNFAESLRSGILKQIQDWQAVQNTRHNPQANSRIHKHFIRRQVEKKLMLTYRMDPTNYSSYGAYFLFLSESSLSDREGSVAHALVLSQTTVQYCMREENSAQALLTGAAAAHDAAQLLLSSKQENSLKVAVQYTQVAGEFLDAFEQVALQMAFDGSWDNYSQQRRAEMTERARLLRKLVENGQKMKGMSAEHQTAEGGASAG